jgi:tetratricopeptide (TPR) repeat protein
MFRLGRLYLNTNQLDSARMVFNEIIKRKWTFGPAYRFLGEVYTKQGNQGLGKKYNTRSFDLPEYNPPSDSLLDKITILSRSDKILLKQIDEAKRGYNFDWAYKLCNHALEYFPENKFILSSMIEVDCINGNIKEAGNLLDRHLTLFGDDFDELIKTADLLYSKGLQSQSLLYFEKAKKLNPESSRLAVWLFDKDKKEEALKIIDEQLKKNPEDERILTDAIHIYLSMGEKEKARILLASLKSHNPSSLEAKKATGMLFAMNGQSSEAMTVYEDIRKENPKDLGVYKYLANLYLKNKLWDKAILNFEQGLEVYPNDPDFLETLGRLLISCPDPKLRAIDEGREYSERAYLHYRGTPETRLNAARNLATAYAVLGNKQIASGYINITMIMAKKLNLPLQEFTSSFALLKKQYNIPD